MKNNVVRSDTGCGCGLNFSGGYLNITMSQEWRKIISTNPLDITIALWVKMTGLEKKQPIFTSYLNSNRFHHFTIRKKKGIRWFMQTGKKKEKIFTVSKNESLIKPNQWHHLAVTFSNSKFLYFFPLFSSKFLHFFPLFSSKFLHFFPLFSSKFLYCFPF